MLSKSKIDALLPILMKDVRRPLRMRVRGFPKPYYCSFLLRDTDWFNTWASGGSTYRKRSDRARSVYCDIRVGRYQLDQTTEGGLNDNDVELDSYHYIKAPIDDKSFEGLRTSLWKLSEAKFREALSDFNHKEALRLRNIDRHRRRASYRKLGSKKAIKYARPEIVDELHWVRFCKNASQFITSLKGISGNFVEFDATQQTKIFVNTERRIIVQHEQVFTLCATIRTLTATGSQLEQEIVYNCASQRDLPSLRTFKREILVKYGQLKELVYAKKIHSFSGPVLLNPIPAGLLFHEAIGHRLEGSRLLAAGEGQTFKGQEGRRIINVPIDIIDDPRCNRFKGTKCIGSFEYDDEGVTAKKAHLVEDGILRGFLNTRADIPSKGNIPNGHARNAKHQRPISRMGVTIVKGKQPVSAEKLKELLIAEIKAQKKPFGMIVYETSGGETDTTSYNFQAFSGEVSYATLVYPDGSEVVARGVDFVGTPLQALNNIIAVGDQQVVDNHYCGAESGFLPVTTICPAILLSNLELQAKDEELITQYILPRPV